MKEIHVTDMKCIHCQEKIEKALKRKGITAQAQLEEKRILVEEKDAEKAVEAIAQAGYTPEI